MYLLDFSPPVLTLVIVSFLTLVLLVLLTPRSKPHAHLPGPAPIPVFGNALKFNGPSEKVWLPLIRSLKEEFGNVVIFYFCSKPLVFLYGSEGFEKILSSSRHISKGYMYQYIWPWLGQGLLTSTGSKWRAHRKMITPTFHFKILEDFLHVMVDQTEILLDKLEDNVGKSVNVHPPISLCSLDIICETAMGTKVGAQTDSKSPYVSAVYDSMGLSFRRMVSPWLYNDTVYSLTRSGRAWSKNLKILKDFTQNVIDARKLEHLYSAKEKLQENDFGMKKRSAFLDLLLNLSKEDGDILTYEDIQDEVDTFMFEGHDTTAACTAVTLYLIALDKEVQTKCQDEFDVIFGDSTRPPTSEDLASMKYLTACIKESLRLYGSVPSISRVTAEDIEIEGHLIPANTEVSMPIALLHRDPKHFPDPEKFDPERFFSEQDSQRNPYSYIPFSAGPRNCIGQKFAMMEVKVIVSSILRRFNMKAEVEMKDMLIIPEIVIKPKDGYFIKLDYRNRDG